MYHVTCVTHGSVKSVTWIISLKNVGHDSIMCAIWPVHICDMRIFMRHRSLSLIRDIPRSSVGHETIMCVTWLSDVCDMDGFDLGWFCFRMGFLASGTWLQSCVRHDPCMCAIWCIHMCDRITHTNVHTLTVIAHCERYTYTYIDTYMDAQMYTHKCAHTNVHAQLYTHKCAHSDLAASTDSATVPMCDVMHPYVWQNSRSYAWHNSLIFRTWNCHV